MQTAVNHTRPAQLTSWAQTKGKYLHGLRAVEAEMPRFYISMVLGMICSPAGCLVRALSLSGCRGLGENSIPSPTPTAVCSKIPPATL